MFINLPVSHFLSKGSVLWIVQPPIQSILSKSIDWHLKFAFRKPTIQHQHPILVESFRYLPNQYVLFLPFDPSDKLKWIEKAQNHWKQLQKPSLRLFLPLEISRKELLYHWPYEHLPYPIYFVLE